MTITAVISPFREDRESVRKIFDPIQFVEIFVDCPIEECERRDVKGHYRRARKGEISNFTGVSSPYESPENPEIWLKSDRQSVHECIKIIVDYLNKKKNISSCEP